jgi:hypothetical protein
VGRADLHAVSFGSRPSCTMAWSPNSPEIQVGDRMKHDRVVPSIFCRLGMIWMALEPLPMMAIFLFRKS